MTPATAVLLAVTATSGSRIWPRAIGLFQFFSDTGFHVVVLHVVTIALKRTVLSGELDWGRRTADRHVLNIYRSGHKNH